MCPLLAFSLLCLNSSLVFWYFLECLLNKQLALESLFQVIYFWEKLGDGGGTRRAIVSHHWLNLTGGQRAWEPTIVVGWANLPRQTDGRRAKS